MKASFIIRLVAAVVLATLGCIGLAADDSVAVVLFNISWLLLIPCADLTRPIPRSEWWKTFLLIVVFVSVMLTLVILNLHLHLNLRHPSQTVRLAVAVPLWFFSMWAIYHRWQRSKGQADA